SPLVVGAIVADRLAARAEARHRDFHAEEEVARTPIGFANKLAVIVNESASASCRGGTLEEVREGDLYAGALGVQALLEVAQETRQRMHRQLAAMLVQNFDEAAHVGALVLVRQRHGEREVCDGPLFPPLTIEHNDRVAEIAHAYLI